MNEAEMLAMIAAVISFAIMIAGPILKLNSSIVKLDVTVQQKNSELKSLDERNREAHSEIYHRLNEKGKILAEHSEMLREHEKEIEDHAERISNIERGKV